jgi:hypothetical protein
MTPRLHNGRVRGHGPFSRALAIALFFASLFVVMLVTCGRVRAHDALTGWSYPFSCCSNFDCRQVEAGAVAERPEGYVIRSTGEVIGHADPRLKDSPDGEYHWCSVAGEARSRTICLFVPPKGY